MATSSHDFEGAITRVAPASGVTAGSVYSDTTDKVVYLALLTATSGSNFSAKVEGRVNGVAKISGTAWTAGQALAHDGTAFTHVVTGTVRVIANAAIAATSAAVTGDVILRMPSGPTPA